MDPKKLAATAFGLDGAAAVPVLADLDLDVALEAAVGAGAAVSLEKCWIGLDDVADTVITNLFEMALR